MTAMCRGLALSALGSCTVRIPLENEAATCALSTRSGSVIVRAQRPHRPFLTSIAVILDALGPSPLTSECQGLARDCQFDVSRRDARQLGRQNVPIAGVIKIQKADNDGPAEPNVTARETEKAGPSHAGARERDPTASAQGNVFIGPPIRINLVEIRLDPLPVRRPGEIGLTNKRSLCHFDGICDLRIVKFS